MIRKIETNQIQDFLEKSSSKQPNPAGAADNVADVAVQVNYASLIEKAIQPLQTDADAVERAKGLLVSGQLETPKNFGEAAKYLLESGV